ncbi:MAG: NAD(P)-binding domain-containing protein [Akkermansiaceae bacterium]|nr:NAD(P)-binding domain-containing protein [Armatimonadota bacterium]
MKIGIIGAGNVGSGLGKRLATSGHELCFSYSRDPAKLDALVASIGTSARSGTPEEAARFGEVVLLAMTWTQVPDAIAQIGDAADGKIVWSAVNAVNSTMTGLAIGTTTSAAEEIARLLPTSNVVEGIPCNAEILHSPSLDFGADRPGAFVCGDDPQARQIVLSLLSDVGLAPTDAGPLVAARLIEPTGFLIAYLAYAQGMGGANTAMKLLRRNTA